MKKRLRKKKYLKEFTETGVQLIHCLQDDDHLWRFITEVVEKNNWFCCGGGSYDSVFDHVIYKDQRYGKFNTEDIKKLESNLDDFDPDRRYEILGVVDLWHDCPTDVPKEIQEKLTSR
jgi:uncharacterized protein YggL (DUF469 family)